MIRPGGSRAADDVRGQIAGFKRSLVLDDAHSLDKVFHFSDVALPVVLLQSDEQALVAGFHLELVPLVVFFHEVIKEHDDVLDTFAQGRNGDLQDIESVEQVLAEGTALDHFLKVAVGGSDHSKIGTHRFDSAYGFKAVLLQYAQKFYLKRWRHFTDFIEKDSAAIGQSKPTWPIPKCAAKSAPLVTEQFAFKERFGDSATVDRDKGTRASR